jgi:hypothetical protein
MPFRLLYTADRHLGRVFFAIGPWRYRIHRIPRQKRAKLRGEGTTLQQPDMTLWERTEATTPDAERIAAMAEARNLLQGLGQHQPAIDAQVAEFDGAQRADGLLDLNRQRTTHRDAQARLRCDVEQAKAQAEQAQAAAHGRDAPRAAATADLQARPPGEPVRGSGAPSGRAELNARSGRDRAGLCG